MRKRRISSIVCALMMSCLLVAPYSQKTVADEVKWDEEISFDSVENIQDKFAFHFVSTQNARREDKFDYTWEIADGALSRNNNIDVESDTVNIAIATYIEDVYDDFEMSVDIKTGSMTAYWPVIGIRQQVPGKYYTTEGGGTGIFMQQNGKISFWGPISNGLIEKNIPDYGKFYPFTWHNLKIRAVGASVTVFLDGAEVITVSVNTTDYIKGYVSLQSVNNDCCFDNFKIRSLSSAVSAANEENKYKGADDGKPLEDFIK